MENKKDKTKCVDVVSLKDNLSFIQKQYDEDGRLFSYDVFLPNCTMASLDLNESLDFLQILCQKGEKWQDEINDLTKELDRIKKEE